MTPTNATPVSPDELAVLKEQIARLEEGAKRRDAGRQAEAELAKAVPPPPKPSEFGKVAEKYSEARRQIRIEAAAEAERAYTEQMERTKGQREKLEQRIRELDEKGRLETERHDEAMASIAANRSPLTEKLNKLSAPTVTYEELLNTRERRKALERLAEEEIGETLPVGTGVTAKEFLESRRKVAGVRY
jgi:hypothetical protein